MEKLIHTDFDLEYNHAIVEKYVPVYFTVSSSAEFYADMKFEPKGFRFKIFPPLHLTQKSAPNIATSASLGFNKEYYELGFGVVKVEEFGCTANRLMWGDSLSPENSFQFLEMVNTFFEELDIDKTFTPEKIKNFWGGIIDNFSKKPHN